MILKQFSIDSFMGLRDVTFTASPGVNLIEGENESGKSTIAAFLKFIFFGLSGSAPKGTLSERAKSIPFQGGGVSGSITLREDGRDYRIERQCVPFQRSFREQCRIVDLMSGEVSSGAGTGKDPAKEFLGVSEEVFLHSAFHGGGEMSSGGKAMQEAIENILFSADAELGTRKALKRLDDARILLLHKNGKGGRLFALRQKEEALLERLQTAQSGAKRICALETDCEGQREKLRQDLRSRRDCEQRISFTDAAARLRLFEKQKKAREDLDRAKLIESDFVRRHSPEGFFPTRDYEGLLARKENEFFESERERSEDAKALTALQGEQTEAMDGRTSAQGETLLQKSEALRSASSRFTLFAILFLTISCAAIGISIAVPSLAGLSAPDWWIIGGCGSFFAFLFLLLSLLRQKKRKKLLAEWDSSIKREDELRESIEELRDKEREQVRRQAALELRCAALKAAEEKSYRILAELDALAAKWGRHCRSAGEIPPLLSDVRAVLSEKDRLHETVLRMEAVKNAEEELSGGQAKALYSPEEEQRLRELLLSMPGQTALNAGEYADCLKKCNFYKQTTEALQKKLFESEKQLAELRAGTEDPSILQQALQKLRQEEAYLQPLHDAYSLAYKKLEEASAGLRERIAPALSEGASSFMSAATEGKYSSLLVDKTLGMHFTADGAARKSDCFSSGTRVLAYLGLRLALLKLLYKTSRPPLLFDESFACVDDRRFEAMLKGMRTLLTQDGPTEQIFLLTSGKRDREICGRVFGDALHLHCLPLRR